MFESLKIIKYWYVKQKERKHYDLKEMKNIKNAKLVWLAWHHNVLTEMFTLTEKSDLLYKKSQIFDQL